MDRWQRRFNQDSSRPGKRRQRRAEVTPEHTPSPILERFTYDAYGQQRPAKGESSADGAQPADAGDIGEGFNYLFQGMGGWHGRFSRGWHL